MRTYYNNNISDGTYDFPFIYVKRPSKAVAAYLIRLTVCQGGYKCKNEASYLTYDKLGGEDKITTCNECGHMLCYDCSIKSESGELLCAYCYEQYIKRHQN